PRSFASASAASTAFWACCSKRTKNSLFLGKSDRRTGSSLVCRAYPARPTSRASPGRVGAPIQLGGDQQAVGVARPVSLARCFRRRRDVWRNKRQKGGVLRVSA